VGLEFDLMSGGDYCLERVSCTEDCPHHFVHGSSGLRGFNVEYHYCSKVMNRIDGWPSDYANNSSAGVPGCLAFRPGVWVWRKRGEEGDDG